MPAMQPIAQIPAMPTTVAAVVASYPAAAQQQLMTMRQLIFHTAATIRQVGELTETLKWGQPAYVTSVSKSGSTIRLAWHATTVNQLLMLCHCRTSLIASFRSKFANQLEFIGNRAIVLALDQPIPKPIVTQCIAAALTYHLR